MFRLSRLYRPNLAYGNLARLFEPGSELTPIQVRLAVLSVRAGKLPEPAELGSAGSFFKNPVVSEAEYARVCAIAAEEDGIADVPHYALADGSVKIPAAWLIDNCGYRGVEEGGAAVYEHQPLVIVNRSGNAEPSDILALEERIIDGVYTKYGIRLSPEVEHI